MLKHLVSSRSDGKGLPQWSCEKVVLMENQLWRCAPHHVRPEIGRSSSTLLHDLQVAKDVRISSKSFDQEESLDLLTCQSRIATTLMMLALATIGRARPRDRRAACSPQKIGSYEPSLARTEDLKPSPMIRNWSPLDLWIRFHLMKTVDSSSVDMGAEWATCTRSTVESRDASISFYRFCSCVDCTPCTHLNLEHLSICILITVC